MRLVLIEWEDSHGDGVWHQLDGDIDDRVLVCRSVGWLVLDGERAKVVAPHLSQQDAGVPLQGCGVMTIPTRSVLRIVDLADVVTAFSVAGRRETDNICRDGG